MSSTPPKPGIQALESLQPTSRFNSDSARSPSMPTAAHQQSKDEPAGRPARHRLRHKAAANCTMPWKLIQEPIKAKSNAPKRPFDGLARADRGRHLVRAEEPADGVRADIAHFHRDDPGGHGADAPEEPDLHGEGEHQADIDRQKTPTAMLASAPPGCSNRRISPTKIINTPTANAHSGEWVPAMNRTSKDNRNSCHETLRGQIQIECRQPLGDHQEQIAGIDRPRHRANACGPGQPQHLLRGQYGQHEKDRHQDRAGQSRFSSRGHRHVHPRCTVPPSEPMIKAPNKSRHLSMNDHPRTCIRGQEGFNKGCRRVRSSATQTPP